MKIARCSACGRLIHSDRMCLFCGSTKGFTDVCEAEVHENSRFFFDQAEMLLLQSSFDDALDALAEVMKWSPNSSEVHWLRLLARSHCKSDIELFFSGVCFTKSPDFDTAMRYASEEEKQVYSGVCAAYEALRKALLDMIRERNASEKKVLRLPETLAEMQQFIATKRETVINYWQELRKCEQELKLQENEGLVYMNECKRTTENIRDRSMLLRAGLEDTFELNFRTFFVNKMNIDAMSAALESTKAEYYRLKADHPAVSSAASLINKRNEIKENIYRELEAVKTYESKIEAVIAQIGETQKAGEEILGYAQNGEYEKLIRTLGRKNFEYAVKYALSQI